MHESHRDLFARVQSELTVHDAADDGGGVLLHPPEQEVVREDGVEAERDEAEEEQRHQDLQSGSGR